MKFPKKYFLFLPFLILVIVGIITGASPERTIAYSKNFLEKRYYAHKQRFVELFSVRDSIINNKLCYDFTLEFTGKLFVQSCDSLITSIKVRDYKSDDFLSQANEERISHLMYELGLKKIFLSRYRIRFEYSKYLSRNYSAYLDLFNNSVIMDSISSTYAEGKFFKIDTNAAIAIE
jgi:hypothetical protein